MSTFLLPFRLHFLTPRTSCGAAITIIQLAKSTNVDAIDSFTNDLVVRKALKWKILQEKITEPTANVDPPPPPPHSFAEPIAVIVTPPQSSLMSATTISHQFRQSAQKFFSDIQQLRDVDLGIAFETLNQFHIDHLLASALYDERKKHFYSIIDQCIQFGKIPSERVALDVVTYLSSIGNLLYTDRFVQHCKIHLPELSVAQLNFDHLIARCKWKHGNSDGALKLLELTYTNAVKAASAASEKPLQTILPLVQGIFREFVEETVEHKSEAVLVAITNVAVMLSRQFDDHQVLFSVWKCCFLSGWFSDQQRATELFSDHVAIRKNVGANTSIMVYQLLQKHNTDAVYRFIELLLRFHMKPECRVCLGFLFEYQCEWRQELSRLILL